VSDGNGPRLASATGLGLGCAELFRLPSARARLRVLDAALDAGIDHFDVAPMYGLGAAERELGALVRGRRERMTIATKYGIEPTALARALARVQGPARRALGARPAWRSRARTSALGPDAGAVGRLLYATSGYGVAAARASLERSLRALGADHVDVLLLHDPPPDRALGDDVAGFMEDARARGLIRTWGVAGEVRPVAAVAAALAARPPVLQVRDDVLHPGLELLGAADGQVTITFGSLGTAIGRVVSHLRARPADRERWRGIVGVDCGDPEALAALLLRHARLRNPSGVTLFGTSRAERLEPAVAAATSASLDAAARALAGLVGAELDAAGERRAPA
jgi:D-threo-aldose 1-dehydrogenase